MIIDGNTQDSIRLGPFTKSVHQRVMKTQCSGFFFFLLFFQGLDSAYESVMNMQIQEEKSLN